MRQRSQRRHFWRDQTEEFSCEGDLCARFAETARALGFKVFAETAEFDMLLVATAAARGFREDDQIGVHAKMHGNCAVLAQATPRHRDHAGPDFYAVLVPDPSDDFGTVCHALKVTVLPSRLDPARSPTLAYRGVRWYRHEPTKRCYVPDCEVPGLGAGVPSPVTLGEWKFKALRLCMLAEARGYLTRKDFREAAVSMTRWTKLQWLEPIPVDPDAPKEPGRQITKYRLNPDKKPPHVRYAQIYDALRASEPM